MLDRMGALGMISVFDVEEVGMDTLVNDVGIPQELAGTVLECCATTAREVQAQQEREKEEEERRKTEEDAAAVAVAGEEGESAAASILGDGPPPPAGDVSETNQDGEAEAATTFAVTENRHWEYSVWAGNGGMTTRSASREWCAGGRCAPRALPRCETISMGAEPCDGCCGG